MKAKILLAVRLVLILALLAAVGWQANQLRSDRNDDSRVDGAVAAAKAQVLDLTTLDSDTVDNKLKAMSDRTSGSFQDQVTGIASTFINIVRQKKISATGRIDGIGVSSASSKEASVLVASTAIVSETGKATPTTRHYRIRVKLVRVGSAWKINGMEFVQ